MDRILFCRSVKVVVYVPQLQIYPGYSVNSKYPQVYRYSKKGEASVVNLKKYKYQSYSEQFSTGALVGVYIFIYWYVYMYFFVAFQNMTVYSPLFIDSIFEELQAQLMLTRIEIGTGIHALELKQVVDFSDMVMHSKIVAKLLLSTGSVSLSVQLRFQCFEKMLRNRLCTVHTSVILYYLVQFTR